MKIFAIATFSLGLLLAGQSFAQSGSVVQQGGAGHAAQASCVILKRMGPADQVTRLRTSWSVSGKGRSPTSRELVRFNWLRLETRLGNLTPR
jgi:hypothetical protein